ncbi:unnamed protein product [Ranitomeya imitator]|uniref:NADH dehydrogenase subunit 6 n=1 Tax=Ranitomeya imitator TaxID=111125 RepID=A0ABN9LNZ2_9NEOB|nr:unnamed protein product [Ranitomeya imitator]
MGGSLHHSPEAAAGKLKIVRRRLLQHYEHQPFISLLAVSTAADGSGTSARRRSRASAAAKGGVGVSSSSWLRLFVWPLVFLYFWGEAKNDYNDFDWFSYKGLGYWFLWSLLILVVVAVLFTYVAILVRRCSDTDNDVDRCSVAVWSLESCHTDRSPATNDAVSQLMIISPYIAVCCYSCIYYHWECIPPA